MSQKSIRILAVTAALGVAAWGLTVFAEGTDDSPGDKPEGRASQDGPPRRPPPRQPLEVALDQDQDGEISAEELEAATASLKKLDKNDDGKLTPEEYRPPRPGPLGRGAGPGSGPNAGPGPRDGEGPPRGPRDGAGGRKPRGPRDGDGTNAKQGDGDKKGDGNCADKSQGDKPKSEGQSE